MRRKHFSMGINMDPPSPALFQKLFKIKKIMSGNKDPRTCADISSHRSHFRRTESFRVGGIQQGHGFDGDGTGLQNGGK